MRIVKAEPADLPRLLSFREEAAAWLRDLGSDQWSRPYPADRLLATIEAGAVFMVRDSSETAATITLSPDVEAGLWTEAELSEPSIFVTKLTVARSHAGRDLGGTLLLWVGDRAYSAGYKWVRLDAWTTNRGLQDYYLRHGFEYVRTVLEGGAVNGGPRVSGWLAQRLAEPAEHGLIDETGKTLPPAQGRDF